MNLTTLFTTTIVLVCALIFSAEGNAASFEFGSNANGIGGLASATLSNSGVSLTLNAGPSGALLTEGDSDGMGINSSGVPSVVGGESFKFDVLSGGPSVDGESEFVTLSFDQPGVITEIDFDGVKDESLEYFVLSNPSGWRVNFFDSQVHIRVPGAVDAAIAAGEVVGDVVLLREDGALDDEIFDLSIPFAPGEVLTLAYAELGAEFGPLEEGNGARFQGIVVTIVPEPTSWMFCLAATTAICSLRWRIGVR